MVYCFLLWRCACATTAWCNCAKFSGGDAGSSPALTTDARECSSEAGGWEMGVGLVLCSPAAPTLSRCWWSAAVCVASGDGSETVMVWCRWELGSE